MRLDRRLADEQLLGDLGVRGAARDRAQHLELAGGQVLELGGGVPDAGGRRTNSSIRRLVIVGREQRVAAGDDLDRLDELLGRGVLEQEAARARAQRLVDVLVEVEGRQHQHPRAVGRPASRRVASSPSRLGMRMSIRTTSGLSARDRLDGLAPVGGLADHLDVRLGVEDHAEAGADERLIVGDQHYGSLTSPPSRSAAAPGPRSRRPPRPALQLTTVDGDPFAHPDEAVAAVPFVAGAPAAVVRDLQLEVVGGVADDDPRAAPGRRT